MTDFDDLMVGMRYQYLRDATFHAFVEVIVTEKYRDLKDELRDYRLAAQAEADQADKLRIEIDRLTGVVQHASEVIAERDFTIKVYEENFGPRLSGSLADENKRLRRALEKVVDSDKAQDCYEIARSALEKP